MSLLTIEENLTTWTAPDVLVIGKAFPVPPLLCS